MTNPYLPYKLPPLRAYILAPGIVQIGDVAYNFPTRTKGTGRPPPMHPEYIVPVRENRKKASRAAMEALYRVVFD